MRSVIRMVALVAAVAGCLGAVAYAAVPKRPAAPSPVAANQLASPPPKPLLRRTPKRLSLSTRARFAFKARGRRVRLRCRLDRRRWRRCRKRVAYRRLAPGPHRFRVRAVVRRGRHVRRGTPARFAWRVLEPRELSIAPRLGRLSSLLPGGPPQALPLTVGNPNPAPVFVTSVTVTAGGDPPGCPSAENLALAAAGVSPAAPLRIPPRASAALPAPGVAAPTIQLRNLPVNQDACQGASFPLSFSGRARG